MRFLLKDCVTIQREAKSTFAVDPNYNDNRLGVLETIILIDEKSLTKKYYSHQYGRLHISSIYTHSSSSNKINFSSSLHMNTK